MLENIIRQDQALEQRINHVWQHSLLDMVAPVLREPKTWIPLYVFLAIYIPWKFGKKGIYWCLGFIITFALSDYTSASVIKPLVKRIRPCNDESLRKSIHLLVECGSGYSFPSTHATNHFALAFFMITSLYGQYRWVWIPAFLWAFSIGYAQVYVGLHYPFDVLCGGLLGILIGSFTGTFFRRKVGIA